MADDRSGRGADGRVRLLDAATAAFAARGFHGTTTRDIATAAGMSSAALYVHHASKEELLYQISLQGHERVLALIRQAIAEAQGPVAQLAAAMRTFAEHHATAHTVARIVNYELSALSEQHAVQIAVLRRAITAELRALVERGASAGVFDVRDPWMTTTALLSLGVDVSRWYRDDLPLTPEQIGECYAEIALRIVGMSHPPRLARP